MSSASTARMPSHSSTQAEPLKGCLSGTRIFVEALSELGVPQIFGYPGGQAMPLFDALYDPEQPTRSRIPFILSRHEQNAVHMADGYYRASGKLAAALVTSGPGALNCVTGLSTAQMDSIPMLLFTGQVPTSLIGNDAFQEADVVGVARPVTKHCFLVKDVRNLRRVIHEAYHIATTGRPGPVVIDLPKDVVLAQTDIDFGTPVEMDLPGYKPTVEGNQRQIDRAASMINAAERPVLYIGGGVVLSEGAVPLMRKMAIDSNIPVTNTLLAKGAFDETHPLSLRMLGMHGSAYANFAVHECDLLIAIGSRFDDRVTGKTSAFAPHAQKIHIDIDPTSISKNVQVDLPIVGDCARVLEKLVPLVEHRERTAWVEQVAEWREKYPFDYGERRTGKTGLILPQLAIRRLWELSHERNPVVVTDVGQHQMWTAQLWDQSEPRAWLSSGGLGTMGYGFPASVGAQVADPSRLVITFAGDGGFQMTFQDMGTCIKNKLNNKVVVLNNQYLGMVRQWQEMFFARRYAQVDLDTGTPSFVKLAEAFGWPAWRVEKVDELDDAYQRMLDTEGPVLLEVRVEPEENVFPMIPSGGTVQQIVFPQGVENLA